jgi:hypothetical protein
MKLTQENNPTPVDTDVKTPLIRLAIVENVAGNKTPLGIVVVVKSHDDKWSVQCSGFADAVLEKIRPVIEGYAAARRASHAGAGAIGPPHSAELAAVFSDLGYRAEELPPSDYQITFQLDAVKGNIVGTHSATHELVAPETPLARQLFEKLAQGFTKATDDLATETVFLIEDNNVEAAVAAVRAAAEKGVFSLPPSTRLLDALVRLDPAPPVPM